MLAVTRCLYIYIYLCAPQSASDLRFEDTVPSNSQCSEAGEPCVYIISLFTCGCMFEIVTYSLVWARSCERDSRSRYVLNGMDESIELDLSVCKI